MSSKEKRPLKLGFGASQFERRGGKRKEETDVSNLSLMNGKDRGRKQAVES